MPETYWILRQGRLRLPPICRAEWQPPLVQEADMRSRQRRDDALSAAADVRQERWDLEEAAVKSSLDRLETLRRELQGVLLDTASTDFRRFQASQLISDVDASIARTQRALQLIADQTYKSAADLGANQIDQAIQAARLAVAVLPYSGVALIDAATANTGDLLSETMLQFANRVRGAVRRIATQGSNVGDELTNLANTIDEAGFNGALYRSEKILRTEVSGVFNGASFQRLSTVASNVPAAKKIWIRVHDNRTRDTHIAAAEVYARGKGIDVNDLFAVGAVKMRYPGDPNAQPSGKPAAKEIINCRCSVALDFDIVALQQDTDTRLTLAFGA